MKKRYSGLLLTALLAPAASIALADGNSEAGKSQYATCAACHGASGEGNPSMNAPAIAGQAASYIERQLQHFRSGTRGAAEGDSYGAQMRPMAMILPSDQAVADVAAYVASLPSPKPTTIAEGDTVAGSKQYQSKCGACHGSSGQGNEALNAPNLTALSASYLIRQVEHFQNGIRGGDNSDKYGQQMKMMAATVNAEQLKDIAAYLSSLGE